MSLHVGGLVGGGLVVGAGLGAASALPLVFFLQGLLPVVQLQAPPFPVVVLALGLQLGKACLDLGGVRVGVEVGHDGKHHTHEDQQRGEQDVLGPLWSRGRKKGGKKASYANVYARMLSSYAHMDKSLDCLFFLSFYTVDQ